MWPERVVIECAGHERPAVYQELLGHLVHYAPDVVAIDGRSGSGKTQLAQDVVQALHGNGVPVPQVVHLDDVYPGWEGLARGVDIAARHIFSDTSPGYPTWRWIEGKPGPWVSLNAAPTLIVEGVGALEVVARNAHALRQRGLRVAMLFIDAPADQRKKAALDRDPEYEPWFEMWARQEEEHFRAHDPAAVAQVIIRWA